MFAQHMLAVCKPGGMVATVMPHGVLFRGGAEKEIRKKFLEQDLIEAIIGLPPNLFYGAGIPACILVMRPNLTGQSPNPEQAREPARPGALHQCRRRVPRRPRAELPAARARREDRLHLRPLRGCARLRAARAARRDRQPGQRLQPQHPPLRGQLAAARAARRARPPARRRAGGRGRGAASAFDALGFDPTHAFVPRHYTLAPRTGRGMWG